jgi:toxin-antitoxin system PIN domain toxin
MKTVSSELLLLDVNVLLALAWPNHQFHAAATRRLESSRDRWATCALTQLGFIRLSSNPAAVPAAKTPAEAATLLASMVKDRLHVYLKSLSAPSDQESIRMFERILGSKQVTDAYLLRLAHQHRARLITFDSKLRALAGNEKEIEILTD